MKKRIVFTGGPGGGKTSAIEILQRNFGDKVVAVPEAASVLYSGGFPRKPGILALRHIQRAIYYVVRELEDLCDVTTTAKVMLCDRGTIDCAAFFPDILNSVGSSAEAEFKRYDLVIHMCSAGTESYRLSGTRIETQEQAVELDKKTAVMWNGHPRRVFVDAESDFMVKVKKVIDLVGKEIEE
ncbi:MAG: ATP-binding protein [Elusimicrobia bacterium]|nr:ATP-binding protein [Elusimicrobiota bacterium]